MVSHVTFARSMQILLLDKGAVVSNVDALAAHHDALEQAQSNLAATGGNTLGASGSAGGLGHSTTLPHGDHDHDKHNPFAPKGKTAKFTNTITKEGKLVEGNMKKAVKTLRPYGSEYYEDEFGGEENAIDMVDLGTAASPTSKKSALMTSKSFQGGTPFTDGGPSTGQASGHANRSVLSTGKSNKSMGSNLNGDSRGGLTSTGMMTSPSGTGFGTGTANGGSGSRYGNSYTLLFRISGEIYSKETIATIIAQNPENMNRAFFNQNEYLIIPAYNQRKSYIPLLPKKFYDNDFILEQEKLRSKAKVNIAFIEGRDHELRYVTEGIFQLLLANTMNTFSTKIAIEESVFNQNKDFIALREEKKPLNPFKNQENTSSATSALPYGVYYNEIESYHNLPIHQKMILELRYLGFESKHDVFGFVGSDGSVTSNSNGGQSLEGLALANVTDHLLHPERASEGNEESKNQSNKPEPAWRKTEEQVLLANDHLFAITVNELISLLQQWKLSKENREFQSVISSFDIR